MTDLEQRIQHLEDLEEIRRLKHYYYCLCTDRAVGGDASASQETISRFADNIVADFTGFPIAEGIEAVSAFYAQGVPSMLSWCQHRVFNEVIDIDGDRASATWYIDCPADFKDGNPTGVTGTGLIAGRYEEEYVKQDGVWKWSRITALLDVVKSYDENFKDAAFVKANR